MDNRATCKSCMYICHARILGDPLQVSCSLQTQTFHSIDTATCSYTACMVYFLGQIHTLIISQICGQESDGPCVAILVMYVQGTVELYPAAQYHAWTLM